MAQDSFSTFLPGCRTRNYDCLLGLIGPLLPTVVCGLSTFLVPYFNFSFSLILSVWPCPWRAVSGTQNILIFSVERSKVRKTKDQQMKELEKELYPTPATSPAISPVFHNDQKKRGYVN